MAKHIAMAGKGGTGKTTIAAFLIKYIIDRKKGATLAVDVLTVILSSAFAGLWIKGDER